MIVVVFKFLTARGIRGITLFPFIFISDKIYLSDVVLLNHEKIHIRQQLELLILPFYFWYILEFFLGWIRFKDANKAYKNISFEKEAYSNEKNLYYLKTRSFWRFLKFINYKYAN